MPISEQDKKRQQELAIQIEIVQKKIGVFLVPFKEGKGISLSKELRALLNQEKQLIEEFMSFPQR